MALAVGWAPEAGERKLHLAPSKLRLNVLKDMMAVAWEGEGGWRVALASLPAVAHAVCSAAMLLLPTPQPPGPHAGMLTSPPGR